MALTASFLATCRALVPALPEYTVFRAAKDVTETASRADRQAAWAAAYDNAQAGQSPAYRLRKAIRDVVNAQADSAGTVGILERETAYATLAAEFVSEPRRPQTAAEEQAEFQRVWLEDQLS